MQAIMLADSQAAALDSLRPLLELAGYRVISAETGAEALEALRHGLFELVIAGSDLAVIDGVALVKRMRGDKLNRNVPAIVVITGEEMPEPLEKTRFVRRADIDVKLMPMVRELTRKE